MAMAEFGEDVVNEELAAESPQRREGEINAGEPDIKLKQDYTTWIVHMVFLLTMFLGSHLASLMTGEFSMSIELSSIHARIFENTGEAWIALLFGGMMVGFGWAVTGACPSLVFVQLGQGKLPAIMTLIGIYLGVILYRNYMQSILCGMWAHVIVHEYYSLD